MSNEEYFYTSLKPFFDAGFLNVLCMTKKICICEAVNFCYFVFPIELNNIEKTPIGMSITSKAVKQIFDAIKRGDYEGNEFFKLVGKCTRRGVKNVSIVFDELMFAQLSLIREKIKTGQMGPHLDPNLSKEIKDYFSGNYKRR